MKKILAIFSTVFLILALPPVKAADLSLSARQAVVMDAATGRVLYGRGENERALIASTTKIMTALVILENCATDEVVRVDARAAQAEGSSIYLKKGDNLLVETLLYGLMLESGNDAALALAIHCSGSVEGFVDLMNAEASRLRMEDTFFANPSGMDDANHYSTARDMARLMAQAMENPEFAKITGTASITLEGRTFSNHNRLLMQGEVDGGKTGYTKAAGRTLVTTAVKNGRRLVVVTFGAPSDWRDHVALYNYAECHYTWVSPGENVCKIPVVGALFESIEPVPAVETAYPVKTKESWRTELELPHLLYAPVQKGQRVGYAVLLVDGEEVLRQELVCPADIRQIDISPNYKIIFNGAIM